MKTTHTFLISLCAFTMSCFAIDASLARTGDLTIERSAFDSKIRLQTSAQFAGAVASIFFRGREFVDNHDHGRELQSASSFDGLGECFNPTEAGARQDGNGPNSTSKLIRSRSGSDWLETETDMAFWLPPGVNYERNCSHSGGGTHAVNTTVRGGYILEKRISIGDRYAPNVIHDHVIFKIPVAHSTATFEAATIYTPEDFTMRYVLNVITGKIEPTDIFGEQELPVILATVDRTAAIGLYSPQLPQFGRGYGSFHFPNTQKLNCVFRANNVAVNTRYTYDCYLAVGTLREVTKTILGMYHQQP